MPRSESSDCCDSVGQSVTRTPASTRTSKVPPTSQTQVQLAGRPQSQRVTFRSRSRSCHPRERKASEGFNEYESRDKYRGERSNRADKCHRDKKQDKHDGNSTSEPQQRRRERKRGRHEECELSSPPGQRIRIPIPQKI